jgi:hypothetical protein
LARDIDTMHVRSVIAAEIWAILKKVGLVSGEAPRAAITRQRKRPELRVIQSETAATTGTTNSSEGGTIGQRTEPEE